ncbi:hypothetical protein Tco_0691944 [Tanacetum coccineum]
MYGARWVACRGVVGLGGMGPMSGKGMVFLVGGGARRARWGCWVRSGVAGVSWGGLLLGFCCGAGVVAGGKGLSSLIPLSRGSFELIVGMDWLSKRKCVIVCYEKVVRIPLEGDEIFRVHGERTLGAAKALMNAKRQVEFRIALVPGATPVATSLYRLVPLEMQELSEQR